MVRTDVSYFQHPEDMPKLEFAHHDGYSVIHLDEGLALFVTVNQLDYLAREFLRAFIAVKEKSVDNAAL